MSAYSTFGNELRQYLKLVIWVFFETQHSGLVFLDSSYFYTCECTAQLLNIRMKLTYAAGSLISNIVMARSRPCVCLVQTKLIRESLFLVDEGGVVALIVRSLFSQSIIILVETWCLHSTGNVLSDIFISFVFSGTPLFNGDLNRVNLSLLFVVGDVIFTDVATWSQIFGLLSKIFSGALKSWLL